MAKKTKPVILLTFANDREGTFLREIAAEADAINEVLSQSDKQGFCKLLNLYGASATRIQESFQDYRGQVRIFHYGGHASGDELGLSSKEGGAKIDAQHFADFLGVQKGLELVFLNGCATQAQKEALIAAGVKHIIVTDRAINDETARLFSSSFYRALARGADIPTAYQEASSGVLMESKGENRSLIFKRPETAQKEEKIPWELYSQPEADLSWQLPTSHRRLKNWQLVAIAVLALTLGSWGGITAYQQSKPFDVTIQVQDEAGQPLEVLKEDGSLSLLLAGEWREGEIDDAGNVYFRNIPASFSGEQIGTKLISKRWETTDSVLTVNRDGNTILSLQDNGSLAILSRMVRDLATKRPLPGVTITCCGGLETQTDSSGRFRLNIPIEQQRPEQRVSFQKEGYETFSDRIVLDGSTEAILLRSNL